MRKEEKRKRKRKKDIKYLKRNNLLDIFFDEKRNHKNAATPHSSTK